MPGAEVLRLEPGTETRIVDFGLALPEAGPQIALNLQMIQFQFDEGNILGKVAANIRIAHMEPGKATTLAVCFDYHTCLLFNLQ